MNSDAVEGSANGISTTLVFQGGGAKGIYHVGALKYFQSAKDVGGTPTFNIIGTAGSSIGALVAALVSVGYSGDELIADNGRFPVAENKGIKIPEGLVEQSGWDYVSEVRRVYRLIFDDRFKIERTVLRSDIITYVCVFAILFASFPEHRFLFIAFLVLWSGYKAFQLNKLLKKMVSFSDFEEKLNDVLTERFVQHFGHERARKIWARGLLFSDLKEERKKLRIVSSNISRQSLNLFSEELTPDERVSRAVAASMAIPLLVRPIDIAGDLHLDGGLVSNMPAWTFDIERAVDPDVHTFVFDLSELKSTSAPQSNGFFSLAWRTAMTSVFGSTQLEMKKSARIHAVPLVPEHIGLLDFDLSYKAIAQAVEDGSNFAQGFVEDRLHSIPSHYRRVARAIGDYVGSRATDDASVRVAIAYPMESHGTLKVRYHSSENDAAVEDRLILPEDSLAGRAFHTFSPQFACGENNLAQECFVGRRDRYRKLLAWPERQWQLAVPVAWPQRAARLRRCMCVVVIEANVPIESFGLRDDFSQGEWPYVVAGVRDAMEAAYSAEPEGFNKKFPFRALESPKSNSISLF